MQKCGFSVDQLSGHNVQGADRCLGSRSSKAEPSPSRQLEELVKDE